MSLHDTLICVYGPAHTSCTMGLSTSTPAYTTVSTICILTPILITDAGPVLLLGVPHSQLTANTSLDTPLCPPPLMTSPGMQTPDITI